MYLELTTMKQAHVTKKNRKIKLVKELYPHVNIRVFYQKDFENLISRYPRIGMQVMRNISVSLGQKLAALDKRFQEYYGKQEWVE